MRTCGVFPRFCGAPTLGAWLALVVAAAASPLAVVFTGADDVAVSAPAYDASGQSVEIALGFAPATGTPLTVVENTGLGFIQGNFTNLAHGQSVNLEHAGKPFRYVADYFGGDGNDLVLRWAASRPLAWGYNDKGQLGNGGTASATLATAVSTSGVLAGKTILAVAMGGSHSLALCADGTLAAWGANNNGQLGNNSSMASSPVPVRVQQTGGLAGKTVVAIAAGEDHNLALCSDGTVAAWGGNSFGKLGDGGVSDRRSPVAVSISGVLAGKSVARIAAGRNHSLAICSDGTVVGWGRNTAGQLGNGETLHSNLVPIAVDPSGVLAGRQVVALAGGESFTLALCSDGTLASWGNNNSGQLGNESELSTTVPGLVDQGGVLAGRTVVEIAVGSSHSLARCEDGLIAAWGYNSYGQLGDGTTSGRTRPTAVDGTGILAGRMPRNLGAGSMFSLSLTRDGTLAAWGVNGTNQLGDFSYTNRHAPIEVVTAHLPEGERFCRVGSGSSAFHTIGLVAVPYAPRMRVDHPDLRVRLDEDATLDFGAVLPGSPVVRSLTLRNDGIEPLAITGVSLTGVHAGDFSAGPPPASAIAPGGSATLPVTFTPGDGFHRRAMLRIDGNDPFRGVIEIDLSATVTGTLAVSLGDPAVPALSAKAITVTGSTVLPTLAAPPAVGTAFMLLENTGGEFITGTFANLAHGQITALDHAGVSYQFIANYHGGSGNDLVLQWAATRPVGWGGNFAGQLHAGWQDYVDEPAAIPTSGLLAGRAILFATSSFEFSIALCADGSIVGLGRE
jgi:alpha-tubulin suppressor-like RCC1 family protein